LISEEPHEETITVINETYPEWGNENGYMICVGGINEEKKEWRRLFPVPYENWWNPVLREKVGFSKWDRIKVTIQKQPHHKDPRKESYKLMDSENIEIVGHVDDWTEKRRILDPYVLPDLETLWEKKRQENATGSWTSMGVLRPEEILDFVEQDRYRVDDEGYRQVMTVQLKQLTLPGLAPPLVPDPINKKIGYTFKCRNNDSCKGHDVMCTDWEVCQLYRKMRQKYGDEEGFQKVRNKMFTWMLSKRDLYLMMGTVHRYPTFINVGVFYPPHMEN